MAIAWIIKVQNEAHGAVLKKLKLKSANNLQQHNYTDSQAIYIDIQVHLNKLECRG